MSDVKGDWRGTHYSRILENLSWRASLTLLEIIDSLKRQPSNEIRNAKYADILDEHYGKEWRTNPNYCLVVLENCDSTIVKELFDIGLNVSKRGRGGYYSCSRFFSSDYYIATETGHINVLNWVVRVSLDDDNCFRINYDDEDELLNA